jgi:hypothetical protein
MMSDNQTLWCDFRHVVLGSPLIDYPSPGDFCLFNLPNDNRGGVMLNFLQIKAYKRVFLPYNPSLLGLNPSADSDDEEDGKLSKSKQAVEDAKEAEKKELQHKK